MTPNILFLLLCVTLALYFCNPIIWWILGAAVLFVVSGALLVGMGESIADLGYYRVARAVIQAIKVTSTWPVFSFLGMPFFCTNALSKVAWLEGDFQAAIHTSQDALKLSSQGWQNFEALTRLGLAQMAMGDLSNAKFSLNRAWEEMPVEEASESSSNVLNAQIQASNFDCLAKIHLAEGDERVAREYFQRSKRIRTGCAALADTAEPYWQNACGAIALTKGNTAEAASCIQKAYEGLPERLYSAQHMDVAFNVLCLLKKLNSKIGEGSSSYRSLLRRMGKLHPSQDVILQSIPN